MKGVQPLPVPGAQGEPIGPFVNLELVIPGTPPAIVIGAHYDSALFTPGANDNGSGVAALVHLANWAKDQKFKRELRFVFFVNEEEPYFSRHKPEHVAMGSRHYAQAIGRDAAEIMISLETMAYYTSTPGTQCLYYLPRTLFGDDGPVFDRSKVAPLPKVRCVLPGAIAGEGFGTGDFVAFVTTNAATSAMDRAFDAFCAAGPGVKAAGIALPAILPASWSDHRSFLEVGIPALMVTDTAPLRYPYYHAVEDSADTSRFFDAATYGRLVRGLQDMIRVLGNSDPPARGPSRAP